MNFLDRDPPTYDDEPDGDEPEDREPDPCPDGRDEHTAGGCVVLMPKGGVPW